MKIARVFLNPHAKQWLDVPMPPGGMNQIWTFLHVEGVLLGDAHAIPRESVHHIRALEFSDGATLYTIPGGKPN